MIRLDNMGMIDATLLSTLNNNQHILCISHVSPDGDAIGSLVGMGWLLRALGKDPTLVLQDEPPSEHLALPGADTIITAQSTEFASVVTNRAFDLVVCLDASSRDRMGAAYNPAVHGKAPLIVIDHHITNTNFGDINWVAPTCAATCQMLAQLAGALGVPLEGPLAECLLTGIVTDTLCFRTSNTNADVLEVAMRLMRGGADLARITERTVNRQPFSLVKLWSLVLPSVQLEEGVIWAEIQRTQFQAAGHPPSDVNLSSFLVKADEADISAVFAEKEDQEGVAAIECSFRAKPGFDVSQVAFSFGGGGHPPASGCTISGTLSQVITQVIPALKAARQRQAQNRIDAVRAQA